MNLHGIALELTLDNPDLQPLWDSIAPATPIDD